MRTDLLNPIQYGTATDRSSGDAAAATASRLEMLALVADMAAPKGYVTTCKIAYRIPGQEFAQTTTLATNYAGIWAWFLEKFGAELDDYGITSLGSLLSPASPIKVAFGRLMPGEGTSMPDRIVTDGNSPDLIRDVNVAFSVASAARDGDTHDVDDVEMSNTW